MNYFIFSLLIILVIIYLTNFINKENFIIGHDAKIYDYEQVNYHTKEQNCGELTFTSEKCKNDTVIPTNMNVCTESLIPITNNVKSYRNNKKNAKNKKNNTMLINDSKLNLEQLQINAEDDIYQSNNIGELETFDDLKTDVRSFASLENDLMTNY